MVGGYAVVFHGHHRTTKDLAVWVEADLDNATKLVAALREFGFDVPELSPDPFLKPKQIVRLGIPPAQIELHTSITGLVFGDCHPRRTEADEDGVMISWLCLSDLRVAKKAAGRPKDLADLDELPRT